MSENEPTNPEDEFRDMLRELLSGGGGIDPSQLAGVAGLPSDPASLQALFAQLQKAMSSPGGAIDWATATTQAKTLAAQGQEAVTPAERSASDTALHLAALWLAETTAFADGDGRAELMTRASWAEATMPVWSQLAEPVASSIADALTRVMSEQAPEEMRAAIQGAGSAMRGIAGALFAMQLGHTVGQLAREAVSGGDIGLPLLDDARAALVPQNMAEFGTDLDIPADEVQLYLSVRELAHSALFRNARWLRLDLISAITSFAHGISIDTERLEELAADFDPSNTEELRRALSNGAFIPPKTDEQLATLARLETTLALIEGWVDTVTAEATSRLPKSGAIAETVRRRRATGGPAERALGTLVGLELRPRRLREAAELWRRVTVAVGAERRDALWSSPDFVPTSADVDDPAGLIARLEAEARGETPEPDELDTFLAEILRDHEETGDVAAEAEGSASGAEPDPEGDTDTENGERPSA